MNFEQFRRPDNGHSRTAIAGGSSSGGRRIEDVSDAKQAERDAEYEERMDEEYAKREGGA